MSKINVGADASVCPQTHGGITLIALVITIIVLLILAGISISLISGGNGILNKATSSRNESNKQTATELIQK